jgi:hypothetical protein
MAPPAREKVNKQWNLIKWISDESDIRELFNFQRSTKTEKTAVLFG